MGMREGWSKGEAGFLSVVARRKSIAAWVGETESV